MSMIANYVLLTGGHTGLGLGVTKKLLKPENKIGLILRNESRKEALMSELSGFSQELVNNIDIFYADLSDQAQVRAVAQEVRDRWPRVDRLFNNAAVLVSGRKYSKQGNELHLEVNALAPYLLTTELESLLLNSADSKVITTVTDGMSKRKLRTDQIMNPDYKNSMMLYAQSKQVAMLLMNELAKSWQGVSFLAVNPGQNKTKMSTEDAPGILKYLARIFFSEPEVGSQKIYNAGFDERFSAETFAHITGDKIVVVKHRLSAQDKETLLAGIRN